LPLWEILEKKILEKFTFAVCKIDFAKNLKQLDVSKIANNKMQCSINEK
jgi:hypothetical protein